MRTLLRQGANILLNWDYDNDVLRLAIRSGSVSTVCELLTHMSDYTRSLSLNLDLLALNQFFENQLKTELTAITNKQIMQVVRVVVLQMCTYPSKNPFDDEQIVHRWARCNWNSRTASLGKITLQMLSHLGKDIDCISAGRRTPLYIAAHSLHEETVRILLESGACAPIQFCLSSVQRFHGKALFPTEGSAAEDALVYIHSILKSFNGLDKRSPQILTLSDIRMDELPFLKALRYNV